MGGAQVRLCLRPGRGFQRRRAKPWTPVAAGCCSYLALFHPPGPLASPPFASSFQSLPPCLLRGRPQWPFSASGAFRKASQDWYLREAPAQKPAGLSGCRVRGREPSGAAGLPPSRPPALLAPREHHPRDPGRGPTGAAAVPDPGCRAAECLQAAYLRSLPRRPSAGRLWVSLGYFLKRTQDRRQESWFLNNFLRAPPSRPTAISPPTA